MQSSKPFHAIATLIAIGLAARVASAAPAARTSVESAQEVLQREHQYSAALLHGDAQLLAAVLADSFVDTSASGVLRNKGQLLQIVARQKSPSSLAETDRKIQVYGDTAVVTVEFTLTGVDQGKAYRFTGRATDVWIKRKGDWYCVAAHSSAVR